LLLAVALFVIAQPAAGDEAEDHRAERRNETQRAVPAAVIEERLLAREEVHEPGVERPGEVGVLVPMRRESADVVRPARRDAGAGPVKVRARQRLPGERRPV